MITHKALDATPHLAAPPAALSSLRVILRTDWKWLLAGALFCFMLASVLMSGWPQGLLPNLQYPFTYSGDGVSHSWVAKRAIEGWIFENPRSGYPFGSNFLDYPGSDSGNLLVLKALGMLAGHYAAAVNLYFLLGFAATFVTAFGVLRAFGLAHPWAFAGAVLFDFVPFHFQRLEHLFYTWYFVVPLFFYIALKIFHGARAHPAAAQPRQPSIWYGAVLLALGSFGVYYAVFGLILFSTAAVVALLSGQRAAPVLGRVMVASSLVIAGVLLNISPNISHKKEHGPNPEVAQRSAEEAEVYGLKFVQLLAPRPDHRVGAAGAFAANYNSKFPLTNENHTASLGAVGALGFLAALLAVAATMGGRKLNRNVAVVALLTLVLFMFGTIGGFGSVFSQLVSASIRGWNRISIVIAFGALYVAFAALQAALRGRFAGKRPVLAAAAALAVLLVGLYDQTSPHCAPCRLQTQQAFEQDRTFIAAIERSLPAGSAVYQLPYMSFPEVPPLFAMATYSHAAGFLQSDQLRWSYAGMRGREGDLFYRALSREPMARQVEVVRRLGFAGIYVDRRGFEDGGRAVVAQLTELLGKPPALQRADGQLVYFALPPVSAATAQAVRQAAAANTLMALAGFRADHLGARYEASFAQGVDFTRPDLPVFVQDLAGLSVPEAWGRWSDANLALTVRIDLARPLPQRFVLTLAAQPFGPNTDRPLTVRLGTQTVQFILKAGMTEYRQPVDLGTQAVTAIELVPPAPVSPSELRISGDPRKLGIGVARIAFE